MEDLKKQVTELQEQLATANEKSAALEAGITELEKKVAAQDEIITELEGKATEQEAVIVELNQKVSEQDKAVKADFPIVKIGKESFQIVIAKFHFNGEIFTAADVKKDPELAKALLEEKSGVLKTIK